MTSQEMFDKVWNHFVVQKQPASYVPMDGWAKCKYRGPNGTKCALGVLMPDELYDPRMDEQGTNLYGLCEKYPDVMEKMGVSDYGLLNSLQNAHDDAASDAMHGSHDFLEQITRRLRVVASINSLRVS